MEKYVRRDKQSLYGHGLKYICIKEDFHPYAPPKDVEITLVEGGRLLELFGDKRWPNTVDPSPNPNLPLMAAAVARCNGEIAGVASAYADCDVMWQLGVDTMPAYRNRGIAKATVSAMTDYIFKQGRLPYYSTAIANLASRKTATSLGFQPAWVELYCREIPKKEG